MMHAIPSFKHWMHLMHDEGAKIAHYTGQVLHAKAFWALLGIIAVIAGMFWLLLLLGNDAVIEYKVYPYPLP